MNTIEAYRVKEERDLVNDFFKALNETAVSMKIASHDKEAFLATYGSSAFEKLVMFSNELTNMQIAMSYAIDRDKQLNK